MTQTVVDRTLVWTGRGTEGVPRGRDAWNTSDTELLDLMRDASEVVVTDPLSFPWRGLVSKRRVVPFTVTLPEGLDEAEMAWVLGAPLLRHMTRYDRLVDSRPEVRAGLTARYALAPEVWEGPGPLEDRTEGKARLYQAVAATREAATPTSQRDEGKLQLGFLGHARELAGPVTAALGCRASRFALEPTPDDEPSPEALVVWFADGQSEVVRHALLTRARDLLHPGGVLIVVGYAVTVPGGPPNPSVSELVVELGDVFGAMLHVEELRSVRWRGDSLSRGVILTATSLRGGVI